MTHILIIDDDTELSSMLGEYLSAEGLHIDYAFDGKQGLEKTLAGLYDAVVLDVMMPELDGFEVLRRIRSQSSVPVLMLTAKGDDIDRIVGLEIGADDYLSKPFNPRELLARLRAVLRRTQNNRQHDLPENETGQEPVQYIGPLKINPSSRTALVRGQVLDLTSTEFNLLLNLVKQAGKIVSKENLSEHGLGRTLEKYDRSIDMHMSNLRKKMAQYELGSMIVTVRGQGYQLSDETSDGA
ncbi:MAG: response regulator transcription factor [Gammaproteobacteria bacterium]|nr:response regulator transcription factor [Gammaproteobacteria bacterium]